MLWLGAPQVDELEREKKLILDGRMSLDEAPRELVDHPVFQISQLIKQILLGGKVSSRKSKVFFFVYFVFAHFYGAAGTRPFAVPRFITVKLCSSATQSG